MCWGSKHSENQEGGGCYLPLPGGTGVYTAVYTGLSQGVLRNPRNSLSAVLFNNIQVQFFVLRSIHYGKTNNRPKRVITKLSSIRICAKLLDVGVSGADLEKADRETLKNWYAEHWVAGKWDPAPVLPVPKGHDLEIEKTKLNLKKRELKARKQDIQLRAAEKRQQVLRSLR